MGNMIVAINFKTLQDTHGSAANAIWKQICLLGEFGQVQADEGATLDVSGCSPEIKKQIAALVAVKGDK
jgi:hypothetical protein